MHFEPEAEALLLGDSDVDAEVDLSWLEEPMLFVRAMSAWKPSTPESKHM